MDILETLNKKNPLKVWQKKIRTFKYLKTLHFPFFSHHHGLHIVSGKYIIEKNIMILNTWKTMRSFSYIELQRYTCKFWWWRRHLRILMNFNVFICFYSLTSSQEIKKECTVTEINKFKSRLKSPKNRFQLSAGLNLEKLNTI